MRDPNHPAHADAQEPSSPTWKLAEAQVMLTKACWRDRVATGRDGLALTRETIERGYNAAAAEFAKDGICT